MHLIDTHSHIYLPEYDQDRDEVVLRAASAGVDLMLMPNIDSASVEPMMLTVEKYKGFCYPMIALHPTEVRENYGDELKKMHRLLEEKTFIGIGETGIDLYWDKTYMEEQKKSFREHLVMAEESHLPLVIHARNSLDIIFDELKKFGNGKIKGVFHAFPGNGEEARRAVDMGFFIGIGGVVTYRNSLASEAALAAGLENVVLETDCPYLTPVPHRGKRNESSYLTFIADKLSEIFETDPEEIGTKTTDNARNLFGLK